jgi:hypothetical protein
MKCLNSTFNAQGSVLIIVVVHVGAVNIYIAAVQALRKQENETQFTTKIGGKLVWVPVISFCKIFNPSSAFDAILCRNWPFSSPNRLTLRKTLLLIQNNS